MAASTGTRNHADGGLGGMDHPIPTEYYIEVFAGCNLRCPLCYAGRRQLRRTSNVLSLADFTRIHDNIRPYAKSIVLTMWGEPTLNPDLLGMIRLVAEREPACLTTVATNASALTREDAWAICRSGLTNLLISLDGHDQESYARYRVGGNFQRVLDFLRHCAEAKAAMGSPINLVAQCLQMAHTIHKRNEIAALAALPGVSFSFKSLYVTSFPEEAERFVAPGEEVQRRSYQECASLRDVLSVHSDGNVVPCCLFPNKPEKFDLGNILETPVEELVRLPDRLRMRALLASGFGPVNDCRLNCGEPTRSLFPAPAQPEETQPVKVEARAVFDADPPELLAGETRPREPYRLPPSYLGELLRDGVTPIRAISDVAIRDLLPYLCGPGTLYELGAGSDYYRRMAPAGQRYVLTNISPGAELCLDMTALDLPDGSADAFFSAFALEHILDHRKAFSEMHRALKPGGRMLAVVPFLYYYHGAPDDYVRFTTSYMRELLAGMRVRRLFGLGTRALLVAEMFHEKPFTEQNSPPPLRLLYRLFATFCTATYVARPRWDKVFPSAVVALAEKPV